MRSKLSYVILVLIFSLTAYSQNLSELVKRVKPNVVTIMSYDNYNQELGRGSGFFINKNGKNYVLTNHHVVEGASSAKIKFNDESTYDVDGFVAVNEEWDLILLDVLLPSSRNITPLPINSKYPDEGEEIFVVGNPLGVLSQTISEGIISSVRSLEDFGKILQITAPISQGSSGSPILNMSGQVIGVVSFQMVDGQNLNFGIPSERVELLRVSDVTPLSGGNVAGESFDDSELDNPIFQKNYSFISRAISQAGWDLSSIDEDGYAQIYDNILYFEPTADIFESLVPASTIIKAVHKTYGVNPDEKSHYRLDGTSVKDFFSDIRYYVDFIEDSMLSEVVRIEQDLLFSEELAVRYMEKGWEYGIIGITETNKVEEIEMELYVSDENDEWQLVNTANDNKSYAFIFHSPPKSGVYKVVIKANRFKNDYQNTRYGLIFFHE